MTESQQTQKLTLSDRMKKARQRKLQRTLVAYSLLAPALAILLLFTYYPALYVFRLSFFDWDLISANQVFVGLENYIRLFGASSEFWSSLWRTLEYGLIYIPLTLILSLALALGLNRIRYLQGFFQSLYFIPSVTSIAVLAVVWSLIFNPQIGPLNEGLAALGVAAADLPQWLNDPKLAIPALAVMGSWQSLGFNTLLLIAGLRNIPRAYYEAAEVDGAGRMRIFRSITLPLLSPVLFFVLFMLMINSFRVFGVVAIMTRGRPLGSTNVLLYFIYQQGFRYFDAGLASAASWVVFMLVLAVALIQTRISERKVFYQ
ncbi:MAG: sugar ABC transporter permease [Anaerolineales bacterium]|nr:sugar ABC transporter permease [Anaerolineales bacterium]